VHIAPATTNSGRGGFVLPLRPSPRNWLVYSTKTMPCDRRNEFLGMLFGVYTF